MFRKYETSKVDLRSSSQPNLPRRPAHNRLPIHTRLALLTQFRITRDLLRIFGIHDHDLSKLTMRACRTVEEHGLRGRDGHVEGSNIGLAVCKRDVAGMNATVHGRAGGVGRGLRDGVVAVAELELNDVADCGGHGVGDEGVLWAADDDGDDLGLALVGVGWEWMLTR
jgi:hypothetical protein